MTRRLSNAAGAAAMAVALVALLPAGAAGQETSFRTPDGHPDLQGVWNFSTATPMERPEDLAGQTTLTAEEAAAWEQRLAEQRAANESEREDAPLGARLGYSVRVWFEHGHTLSEQRTSLVIDPPDGRIPAVRPEVAARAELRSLLRGRHAHGPEDRGASERCLLGFNSGPPMTPSAYNNNMQVFQTEDHVVLFTEMVHDARIVPLDGRDQLPGDLRQWSGSSRAHWDGDTLVVETTNFLRETGFMRGGSTRNLHLTERLTRVAPDTLLYDVTVNDPTTWTRPWSFVVPMQLNPDPLYEYACHEGNYGLYNILAGAR